MNADGQPEAGQHEYYCPFDGHKAQGMTGTLTVGSSSSGASAGGAGTSTPTGSTGGTTGGRGY